MARSTTIKRVLVTGASGQLGRSLQDLAHEYPKLEFVFMDSKDLDITDSQKVKETIKANPRKYIAQPIMALSTHPTYIEENQSFEPRHVDLRTFTLLGKDKEFVLKGGLSRVALSKGNLVVNSSQGGGSKDTWVLKK